MRKNGISVLEFKMFTQDGIFKILREHFDWYNKSLRVILLAEPNELEKRIYQKDVSD
jgi:hypothetical protein